MGLRGILPGCAQRFPARVLLTVPPELASQDMLSLQNVFRRAKTEAGVLWNRLQFRESIGVKIEVVEENWLSPPR
jgi:hypothetical protein